MTRARVVCSSTATTRAVSISTICDATSGWCSRTLFFFLTRSPPTSLSGGRRPRAQIERAAKLAQAYDFITHLSDGYDTVLGEGASNLSGGQRQRLAIARALLPEPAILLLDDPTAAVDSGTEHEIFVALDGAMVGRTTFLVAHRVSTLRRADRVMMLDAGRIAEFGPPAELARKPGGRYRPVAELQVADAESLRRLGRT